MGSNFADMCMSKWTKFIKGDSIFRMHYPCRYLQYGIVIVLLLSGCDSSDSSTNTTTIGFEKVSQSSWTETSVRKVLHTFAYGGLATDGQIQLWAGMSPDMAVREMLTFEPFNDMLSPPEDAARLTNATLEDLQALWSSSDVENPVRVDRRDNFSPLVVDSNGLMRASVRTLQNTWIQAVTTRGLNPFRHKVGLFLTNYLMALPSGDVHSFLLRSYYDDLLSALEEGEEFTDVQALAAMSGGLAFHYGHYQNVYTNRFHGNDDFAREFHQLVFGIQGDTEDADYHENTTIEHTAWLLTGMRLDREYRLNGSDIYIDWLLQDIVFTDHYSFGTINNFSNHYSGCLEILHQTICGDTAGEKMSVLSKVASNHPESLANLPVMIINHFGDDNLDERKMGIVREAWSSMETRNLLKFIRTYAISKTFHSADRIKYRTAFNRNLLIKNLTTLDNEENFALSNIPRQQMSFEGADVFSPIHGVFGGQTGSEASVNTSIFREAYLRNVKKHYELGAIKKLGYVDSTGSQADWYKDWASVIPANNIGGYDVVDVGLWLWTRIIGDGGKNYDALAQEHVESLLSTGIDLNTAISSDVSPLLLDSTIPQEREEANRRISLAINFITMMPFMFAEEGK